MSNKLLAKIILGGFTSFFLVISTLPLLAPIFAYFGFRKVTDIIYELYSFFCHQKAHRSMFIFDEQCAWCVRDTFIWSTLTVVWIMALINFNNSFDSIKLRTAFLFCLPMALDGGIQLIASVFFIYYGGEAPFYESTNTIRAITGSMFGIGLGMYLFPKVIMELRVLLRN